MDQKTSTKIWHKPIKEENKNANQFLINLQNKKEEKREKRLRTNRRTAKIKENTG